ncbi:MAG TPA: hypothetical protein VIJ95_13180 [Hanamia sp.]
MRRIQIKIWPEVDSQYPAIISLERIDRNKKNPIDIDFTNAYKISSTGLNILLLNLIKISQDLSNHEWDIIPPKNIQLNQTIKDLNFYSLLITRVPNQNLFWATELNRKLTIDPIIEEKSPCHSKKCYPIYELDFVNNINEKRKIVEKFKQFLIQELFFLQDKHDFDLSIFIQVLIEMAKNSADHTDSNAYFGLDIISQKDKIKIYFSFGDIGNGINQTIRKFIKHDSTFKEKEKHLALTDSYHWALQIGNTTKPYSNINKGIGMSTIFNLSKQLKFSLSVFDAESRGILSFAENLTHVELRKIFYAIGFKVGFYYYGETEINIL